MDSVEETTEKKIIITVAVTGSRATKEMNPAVPYTPKEITHAAVESHKAGAAIAHVHVRDPKTGRPSLRIELFKEVLEGIREQCDMIINLTTSPLWFEGLEENVIKERLQRVYLKPDMCSFDLGSMNLPDMVAVNSPKWGEAAAKCMQDNGVKPEIEVFDAGPIYQAIDFIQRGLIDDPPYFQICMGVKWGIEASAENLLFMKSKLPSKAVWSALGIGKTQLPMITMAMLLGGNVRVGFEDNIYLRKGVLASSNANMVEMAADLAERLGRSVATSAEARRLLGIKKLQQ
jgi:3-keto-5-aminohexanoate cleavage enzyme